MLHHGILLNLIFAKFCRIILEKIRKFIFVKTYLGQGEYYLKISAKLVKEHPKNRILDTDFFGQKPTP